MKRAGAALAVCMFLGCSGGTSSGGGSLSGTWDLVATSQGGSQSTGAMTLSSSSLDLTLGDTRLTYTVTNDGASLAYARRGNPSTLSIKRTTTSFGTGAIELPIGGGYDITDVSTPGSRCVGNIGVASTALCENANLPSPFPDPRDGRIYKGTRNGTGPSIFGELGGSWTFVQEGESNGCTATFSGNTVQLQCDGINGKLNGTVNLTFAADLASVSGTTSAGLELSGRRR